MVGYKIEFVCNTEEPRIKGSARRIGHKMWKHGIHTCHTYIRHDRSKSIDANESQLKVKRNKLLLVLLFYRLHMSSSIRDIDNSFRHSFGDTCTACWCILLCRCTWCHLGNRKTGPVHRTAPQIPTRTHTFHTNNGRAHCMNESHLKEWNDEFVSETSTNWDKPVFLQWASGLFVSIFFSGSHSQYWPERIPLQDVHTPHENVPFLEHFGESICPSSSQLHWHICLMSILTDSFLLSKPTK